MEAITQKQLQDILAASDADPRAGVWTGPIKDAMAAAAIDSGARRAAFLAQVLHESLELRRLEESLSYSAERLHQVWPRHFPTIEAAVPFSHAPQKLAGMVYANRLGNGDESSGDGWTFRGRGLIQLTGRANYASFAKAMNVDALVQPDLLREPAGAALSAAWFWQSNGLNELADRTAGAEGDASFVELTRRINGGRTGLAERRAYWMRACAVLGVKFAIRP